MLNAINTFLIESFGPLGPLFAVGGLGLLHHWSCGTGGILGISGG